MRSTPSLRSFPNFAFETVPMFVRLTMAFSRPFKEDRPLWRPLSTMFTYLHHLQPQRTRNSSEVGTQVVMRFAVGIGLSGVCMFHVLIVVFILALNNCKML